MITMQYKAVPQGLLLQFNIPFHGKIKRETAVAKNLEEAKRMMYFRNRKYIHAKLSSWLHQREYAIVPFPKIINYAEKLAAIQSLLLHLEYYEKASFWHMCTVVCKHLDKFQMLAPGEKSRHYNFYSREILPVLDFCVSMKGSAE